MTDPIYLDHAASTPLAPGVLEAMLPWLRGGYGNPSALYALGREAQQAIDQAREQAAAVLNARPSEIVFTSGGTESVNAALRGIAFAGRIAQTAGHVVTTAIEHHCVLHTCQYLERFGIEVSYVQPDAAGRISVESVAEAIRPETGLVSVMLANNEVGTLLPVVEIVRAVRERAAALQTTIAVHTDAVQAPSWLPLDVRALGVDALSLSAHKFGGPKGVGLLYLRRGVTFLPQQSGGGQERQRRAGTENVAGIVGAGVALRLAEERRTSGTGSIAALRDRLEHGIRAALPSVWLNGDPTHRLPNTTNLGFPGLSGDTLVEDLDRRGVAASSGSACANMTWEPSHVLMAMGQTQEQASAAVRFTLGYETDEAQIDHAIAAVEGAVFEINATVQRLAPTGS